MHVIAVLALEDFVASDVATPYDVFPRVRDARAHPSYGVMFCGESRRPRSGRFSLQTDLPLERIHEADTIIVAGTETPLEDVSPRVTRALGRAAQQGRRIASICTGAFVLAEAGLLDGLRATTHWLAAPELARRYPAITVNPNVLFVNNGNILTSAGATAGLDLCLHLIRTDLGASVAAHAARLAVAPLSRDGGQAQYIEANTPARTDSLQTLLEWLNANLAEPVTLNMMAARSAMSARTLTRRFSEQLGCPPGQWLGNLRIRRAQELLETTTLSVEVISEQVGFASASAFREKFRRVVGVSPRQYQAAFNAATV